MTERQRRRAKQYAQPPWIRPMSARVARKEPRPVSQNCEALTIDHMQSCAGIQRSAGPSAGPSEYDARPIHFETICEGSSAHRNESLNKVLPGGQRDSAAVLRTQIVVGRRQPKARQEIGGAAASAAKTEHCPHLACWMFDRSSSSPKNMTHAQTNMRRSILRTSLRSSRHVQR